MNRASVFRFAGQMAGLSLAFVLACGSDDGSPAVTGMETGGSAGTANPAGSGGSNSGTGGQAGSNSTTTGGGAGSTGGSGGSGGAGTGGGSSGSAGSGGGSGGSGGSVDAGSSPKDAAVNQGSAVEAGPVDAGPFAITSTAFVANAMIPAVYTCAGDNTSPPLAWTPGPAATKSYALVLKDNSNMFTHWAVWDIPATAMGLPANLPAMFMLTQPAGAKQTSFSGKKYAGPCPSGATHDYEYNLYALNVDTVPGLTTNSDQAAASTEIMKHVIVKTSIIGKSNASQK